MNTAALRARIDKLEAEIKALAAARNAPDFAKYAGRELDFCRDHFLDRAGAPKRYWSGQEAILTALGEHRRVAVRSCHKAGKTELLADAIIAFTQTAPTIVISTAAGARQVETGLWSRVNAQFNRSRVPLLGECMTMQLKVAPDHFALGFSTNNPTSFQGAHAGIDFPDDPPASADAVVDAIERAAFEASRKSNVKRLVFAFDEAFGIDRAIFEAAAGSMLGEHVYVVQTGNPTAEIEDDHPACAAHRTGSGYYRIKLTAPDDDEEPDRVPCDASFTVPSFIATRDEYDKNWPKGTPQRNPRALGRFMEGDVSGRVIPYAFLRDASIPGPDLLARGAHVGFDTAADGGDANAAYLAVDGVIVSLDTWHSQDTLETWARMKRLRDHWQGQIGQPIPWRNVHIDDAPIAKGIIEVARRESCSLDCVGFGSSPTNNWDDVTGQVAYKNRRAELYWVTRELLRLRKASIGEKYAQAWKELAAHAYHYNEKGLLVIEPKDEVKKRLGKSPDHADAVVLALATKASEFFLITGKRAW